MTISETYSLGHKLWSLLMFANLEYSVQETIRAVRERGEVGNDGREIEREREIERDRERERERERKCVRVQFCSNSFQSISYKFIYYQLSYKIGGTINTLC
jgi:hypothetical protein